MVGVDLGGLFKVTLMSAETLRSTLSRKTTSTNLLLGKVLTMFVMVNLGLFCENIQQTNTD